MHMETTGDAVALYPRTSQEERSLAGYEPIVQKTFNIAANGFIANACH